MGAPYEVKMRFPWSRECPSEVNGEIGYYDLAAWWLQTFTKAERTYIEARYRPISVGGELSLTEGNLIGSTIDDPAIFLNALASWFRKAEDKSIADRIRAKIDQIGRSRTITKPGYCRGRHFTSYCEQVKQLKRDGKLEDAEELLLSLIDATEAESDATLRPPPPWYCDQLRIVYRKMKRPQEAIDIMVRYERSCEGKSPEAAWQRAQEELRRKFF